MIFELSYEQAITINENLGIMKSLKEIPGQDENIINIANTYIDLVEKINEGVKDV